MLVQYRERLYLVIPARSQQESKHPNNGFPIKDFGNDKLFYARTYGVLY